MRNLHDCRFEAEPAAGVTLLDPNVRLPRRGLLFTAFNEICRGESRPAEIAGDGGAWRRASLAAKVVGSRERRALHAARSTSGRPDVLGYLLHLLCDPEGLWSVPSGLARRRASPQRVEEPKHEYAAASIIAARSSSGSIANSRIPSMRRHRGGLDVQKLNAPTRAPDRFVMLRMRSYKG
jgi:hypothetical protein